MAETGLIELLTAAERRAFSGKLAGWARTLTPKEQEFLAAVLRAAGGARADTAGHMLGLPVPALVQAPPARHDTAKNAAGNVR